MDVLSPLARMIPFLLTIYLGAKLIDMVSRGTYTYLNDGTLQSFTWLAEIVLGVLLPGFILMTHRLRRQVGWLFTAAALIVFGVALNRVNVFIIGYNPVYADGPYVPAWPEIMVTVGLISLLVLLYRFFVFHFPILHEEGDAHHA